MDNELMLDVGQANEFKLACRRAGYTNGDIKRMCEGDILERILPVVRGQAEMTQVTHTIDLDADPLIPYEGWKVEEHRKGGQFTWDPEVVKLYLFPNQRGDKSIRGHELRKELAGQMVFNANLLDYLLDHPHLIPEAWKADENGDTSYIYFWGTVYQDSVGSLCVRCLYFNRGRWKQSFGWLGHDWGRVRPAAVGAS